MLPGFATMSAAAQHLPPHHHLAHGHGPAPSAFAAPHHGHPHPESLFGGGGHLPHPGLHPHHPANQHPHLFPGGHPQQHQAPLEPPKPRFLFRVPRVVPNQKEKFESDELMKRHAREGEVGHVLVVESCLKYWGIM
jgi:hypothetical protein